MEQKVLKDSSSEDEEDKFDQISFQIGSNTIKIRYYKLCKYSQIIPIKYPFNYISDSFQKDIQDFQQIHLIKEQNIISFLYFFNNGEIQIENNNYYDILKLSEYFQVKKLLKELKKYRENHKFDVNHIITMILYEAEKYKDSDIVQNVLNVQMEQVLVDQIDECLNLSQFKKLPVSIIYRILSLSDKNKISSDLLLDIIKQSIDNFFVLLQFLDIQTLSYAKFLELYDLFQHDDKKDVHFRYLPINLNYIKKLKDNEENNRKQQQIQKQMENDLQNERKNLNDQLFKAQNEIKNLRDQLDKLQNENKNLNEQLNKSQNESKNLNDQLNKSQNESKNLKEQLNKSQNESKNLNDQLNKSQNESKNLKEQLNKSQNENKNLNEQLNKSQNESKSLKEQLIKSQNENKNLNDQLNKSQNESKSLKEQLNKSQNESKSLKEQLNKSQNESKTFKDQLSKVQIESKNLQSESRSFKDQFDKLKNENKNFKDQLNKNQKEFGILKDQLNKSQNECKSFKEQLSKVQNESKNFQNEIKSNKDLLNKSQNEIKTLKNQLYKSQKDYSSLDEQLNKAQSEIKKLKNQNEKFQNESNSNNVQLNPKVTNNKTTQIKQQESQLNDFPTIVIDNGTGVMKAGFAGDEAPRLVFPSIVGYPKNQSDDVYVNFQPRSDFTIKYPIDHGIITNWDDMEYIWDYIFDTEFEVDPTEHPILMTNSTLNTKKNKEKITQIMFETYNVPSFYLGDHSMLSLYSAGKSTGVILDIGYNTTYSVPFYEGCSYANAINSIDIGGRDLHYFLGKMLCEKGYQIYDSYSDRQIIREMKEKLTYVALDYQDELMKAEKTSECDASYRLQDKNVIVINSERFRCPELLFKPEMYFLPRDGIDKILFDSIMKCEKVIHKNLFENIILSGGSSLFKGLPERIEKEIELLASPLMKIKVFAEQYRQFSAWIGGSIFGSLYSFKSLSITKDEYKNDGIRLVHSKFSINV